MKKIIGIIIFVFLFSFLTAKSASAYITVPADQMDRWEDSVYGIKDFNLPSHTNETFIGLATAINEALVGPKNEAYRTMGKGAIYAGVDLISYLYANPPASTEVYLADLGKNFGLAKPAYAQEGTGFTGLLNLLPLWKACRNIAYVFFVIAFLYIGLAIMFRIKIDPKTVTSIQNALPKLIIALLLVTFSYAIAGLLVECMYLLIYLGILAFEGPIKNISNIAVPIAEKTVLFQQQKFTALSFGEVFGILLGGGLTAVTKSLWGILGLGAYGVIFGILSALLGATGALVGSIPVLIFAIIILYLVIKLFFSLLTCYMTIIISVISAPLQILIGVLPGNQGGFGSWFKNLIANILVFPATALFLFIIWLLMNSTGPGWTPPVLSVSGQGLASIIGLGGLFLVNKIPEMVKGAFKMKPSGYGTAIGAAFGPVKLAYPAGRQVGAEQFLGFGPGAAGGWQLGWKGTAGRVGQAIGLWREPK